MTATAPRLTLADLERHDPRAPSGNGHQRYLCPLPACADRQRKRNLSLNTANGLWKCHGCDTGGRLVDADTPDGRPRPRPQRPLAPPKPPKPKVVKTQPTGPTRRFPCQDHTGVVRGVQCRQPVQVTRADGSVAPDKQPWWELPDGTRGLGGRSVNTMVYVAGGLSLDDIPEGADVPIGEGPPVADAFVRLGCPYAIALVGGAGTQLAPELLARLSRFRCYLAPDNDPDDKGQACMRHLGAGLLECDGYVPLWLELPVGPKGDAVDYEQAGGTADDLAARMAAARTVYHVLVDAAVQAERDRAAAALGPRLVQAQSDVMQALQRPEAPMVDKAVLVPTLLKTVGYTPDLPERLPAPLAAKLAAGWAVLPPFTSLAQAIGGKEAAVKRVLHKYAPVGGYELATERCPTRTVDRVTGEIRTRPSQRTLVRWGSDGAALAVLGRLARGPLPDDLHRAGGERTPDARCAHCGGKLRWHQVRACADCGRQVELPPITERLRPSGQFAPMEPEDAEAGGAAPSDDASGAPLYVYTGANCPHGASATEPARDDAAPAAGWTEVTPAADQPPNPALDPTPTARAPARRCFSCGSTRWWRRPDGSELVCGVCHPPPGPRGDGGPA